MLQIQIDSNHNCRLETGEFEEERAFPVRPDKRLSKRKRRCSDEEIDVYQRQE